MKNENKKRIRQLTVSAILIAMQVVLSRFLSINLEFFKIGFAFIPIMLAAYYFGITGGVTIAVISDLIGALLFPSGPFFPGFTLSAALTGFIYGIFIKRKNSTWMNLCAVLLSQIINGLLLNTLWLSLLYGSDYKALMVSRLWQIIPMIVVEFGFTELFFKRIRVFEKIGKQVRIW